MITTVEIKNILLILIVMGLVLLSYNFLRERYDVDQQLIIEKDNLGKYISKNFQGKITGHLLLEIIRNTPDIKSGPYFSNQQISISNPDIRMNTITKLMDFSFQNNIDFLVMEDYPDDKHFPIFSEIFYNEKNFSYLEKVFDSDNHGYKKLRVKIFKINYDAYKNLK